MARNRIVGSWRKLDTAEKIQLSIAYALRFSLILAMVNEIMDGRWWLLFLTSLALLITFIPSFIERNYKMNLPVEFELFVTLFIYASMYLGERFDYYYRYLWWDSLLHASSSIVLGIIGFLILYELHSEGKIKAKPIVISFFAFSFAVAMGAIWEIFEFAMDVNFGTNMQKTGLLDTMSDIILDTLGALVAAGLGFTYMKGVKNPLFKGPIIKFIERNPEIFREK